VGGDMGEGRGSAGRGDKGGALEQRNTPRCRVSSERELGETFLGPFARRTRLLHLPAQRLHPSDVEPGVMSDDDDIGGFKDTVERRDEFRLSRSIHCKLFPVDDPCPSRRLRPAALAYRCTNAGRTVLLKSCPSSAT